MLRFNDGRNYLRKRIRGVKRAYGASNMGGGVAVDVGANVGAFPIVYHDKFDRIICVEPSEYSIVECAKNTIMFGNVEVYQFAVSDISGKIVKLKPYKSSNLSGNASIIDSDLWDSSVFEEVETISLEDIFTRFGVDRIDYLKVDCEGGEYDFLMNKDLSRIDFMGIEIHVQLGDKADELYKYLLGYFNVLRCLNDGVKMHRELLLKRKI